VVLDAARAKREKAAMNLAYASRLLRRSLLWMTLGPGLAGAARAEPPDSPPAAPAPSAARLRIKNARAIRVSLGSRRHEPASAIRPEKGLWNVIFASDLGGASAELQDVTPDAPRSRWVVDVQGDKLVLDGRRFLPTHVYQMDVRKERRLVGSALVYLYPPPAENNGRVEFKDEETTAKKDDSGEVSRVPKGDL
jgi:hypothetical protein